VNGDRPEDNLSLQQHGESLKTRIIIVYTLSYPLLSTSVRICPSREYEVCYFEARTDLRNVT
jgi:hypothetical protein